MFRYTTGCKFIVRSWAHYDENSYLTCSKGKIWIDRSCMHFTVYKFNLNKKENECSASGMINKTIL